MQPSEELNQVITDAELVVRIVNLKNGQILDLSKNKQFSMWVIYKKPKDYPDFFVARRWILDKPTDEIILADTLDELRKKIPYGLIRFNANIFDDPVIIEIWM